MTLMVFAKSIDGIHPPIFTPVSMISINKLLKCQQNLAKGEWEKFHWKSAEAKYRDRLRTLHSTTRLLGNPKPIVIDEIFTDVYVLDKITAFKRFQISKLQSLAASHDPFSTLEKRRAAIRVVMSEKRLYLLGKPGAGKTTFLKYLVLKACEGKIRNTPVFISLKEWNDSRLELLDFIIAQFTVCSFPNAKNFIEHILDAGKMLILFDGLDEVNQVGDKRNKMINTLTQFAQKYPEVQIILTCRIAATDYSFTSFSYLEIADFDDRQIGLFLRKWYQDEKDKLNQFINEFDKPQNKGLKELARTPLLLALLCLAFDETMTFPTRLVDLYKEAIEALLKKWDSSRGIRRDEIYRQLSPIRKEHMLARIASANFEVGDPFFPKEKVVKQINQYLEYLPNVDPSKSPLDGETVLKAIEMQHGLLVERAHNIYSFSHLSFQEYFTARHIIENAANGQISELIKNHLTDSRWHEVFLLVASLMDNADSFIETFLEITYSVIKDDSEINWLLNLTDSRVKKSKEPGPTNRALFLFIVLDMIRIKRRSKISNRYSNSDYELEGVINIVRNQALDLTRDLLSDNKFEPANSLTRARIEGIKIGVKEFDKKWSISTEQAKKLSNYLAASKLLIDCLRLAVVSDRSNFEARVLMPVVSE